MSDLRCEIGQPYEFINATKGGQPLCVEPPTHRYRTKNSSSSWAYRCGVHAILLSRAINDVERLEVLS